MAYNKEPFLGFSEIGAQYAGRTSLMAWYKVVFHFRLHLRGSVLTPVSVEITHLKQK
jgi:hypothetical protein